MSSKSMMILQFGSSKRALAASLLAFFAGACGYRPAGDIIPDDEHCTAVVPAFTSNAGYPELDVFAGEHLASRVTALGVTALGVSASSAGDGVGDGETLLIRGFIISAREVPLGLHSQQTTVQIELDTQVEVSQDGGDSCETSVATGTATLSIPFGANSEPALLAAMQAAAVDAIEQLLLEVLLCVRSQSSE